MTIVRTLGFTLCITALMSILLAQSVLQISFAGLFLISAAIGIGLYYLFGPEDHLQSTSLVFISVAVVTILAGFLTNAFQTYLSVAGQRLQIALGEVATSPAGRLGPQLMQGFATVFNRRTVLLELAILFVGLFGPAVALLRYKEHEKIDYGILVRSAAAVAIVYVIAFIIYYWALANVGVV